MKILITGDKGFIGSHVKAYLDEDKITAFTVHNYADFLQAVDLIKKQHFDIVLHIGAICNTLDTSARLWQMNVCATQVLIDAVRKPYNKFVFISSYVVNQPQTDYATTKIAGERIVRESFREENLCILRPASVWGDDEAQKTNPSIIYKLRNGRIENLFTNWYRDFVRVEDVSRFIAGLVDDWTPGTFELGTGVSIPCSELATVFPEARHGIKIAKHRTDSELIATPERLPPKKWNPTNIWEFRNG